MSYSPSMTDVARPVTTLSNYHPLDEFYANAGRALPKIEVLDGIAVPEPYRQLLVHEGDMTPMLEKFYGATIHLEVRRREKRGDFCFREVVLLTDDSEKRVEFGAIKISLDRFPASSLIPPVLLFREQK